MTVSAQEFPPVPAPCAPRRPGPHPSLRSVRQPQAPRRSWALPVIAGCGRLYLSADDRIALPLVLGHHAYRGAAVLRSTLLPASDTVAANMEVGADTSWHLLHNPARHEPDIRHRAQSRTCAQPMVLGAREGQLPPGPAARPYEPLAHHPKIIRRSEHRAHAGSISGYWNPILGRSPRPPRTTAAQFKRSYRNCPTKQPRQPNLSARAVPIEANVQGTTITSWDWRWQNYFWLADNEQQI